MDEARSVREFWFGKLPPVRGRLESPACPSGFARPTLRSSADCATEHIRERFGELLEQAAAGLWASWADGPRRRLRPHPAARSVSRGNMFRGQPARAFAYDGKAPRPSRSRACSQAPTPPPRSGRADVSSTCRCSTPRAAKCRTNRSPPYRRLAHRGAPAAVRTLRRGGAPRPTIHPRDHRALRGRFFLTEMGAARPARTRPRKKSGCARRGQASLSDRLARALERADTPLELAPGLEQLQRQRRAADIQRPDRASACR